MPETISVNDPPKSVSFFSNILLLVASSFWTEDQRKCHADDILPWLLRYLESKYGKDKPIAMDWVAITATAR